VTPKTPRELPFDEIWLVDFEFISRPGERPDVVCLAARELRSRQTIALRRVELRAQPPYRTDNNVVFISFVGNAEVACHLSLNWPAPERIIDLSPAFRNIVNGRSVPEGKGLLGALRYYGLDTISPKQKDTMRDRIMQGWPFTDEEWVQILAYCISDVDALERLLPCILAEPEFDLGVALYHGEFVAVSALMEYHGVPIGPMAVFKSLTDKQTWSAIRDAMVPAIDAKYDVYVRGAEGDWHFNMERFHFYLEREGITDWPLLATNKLDMRRKTFEEMSKGRPQLEELRQLRFARDKMRRVRLTVGQDERNRTILWPFKAKTSRTQPKASQWIFSPAVWLRSLIRPEPGQALAYIDYSSMEFLIAASLSDGHCCPMNNMLEMYKTGDPYWSFAKRVGAVPSEAAKKSYVDVRNKYKNMLLAVQYGMGTEALATRLGVSSIEAHQMLSQHKELFAQYWRWSDDWVQAALQSGVMRTVYGWTCRTDLEFNERSIRNWPIQATGADILRIACILMVRHGIKLLAPIHDAVLIESSIDNIEKDVALARQIMRRASRIVLNADATGTHELRTDYKIIRWPDRYCDLRGEGIWVRVLKLLEQHLWTGAIGAVA
jgi:hypothetical protein